MRYKTTLGSLALMVGCSIFLFRFYESQLSDHFLNLAVHPELEKILMEAVEDKKALSKLNRDESARYRAEFEHISGVRKNLLVLGHSRNQLKRNFQWALWLLFAVIMLAAGVIHVVSRTRVERRIAALQQPLSDLAAGKSDVRVPNSGGGVIGRIGTMIEKTSQLLASQREQLAYLDHLSSWQEASRRHTHELRTPLTAARMEVEALLEAGMDAPADLPERVCHRAESIMEELDHLKRFTQEFTSFARIPKPKPESLELVAFIGEFCELFARGWQNLSLQLVAPDGPVKVMIDRDMVRQVLVNLCNNSALSGGEHGALTFSFQLEPRQVRLLVADNGPGIAAEIADKIFEPYVTTRVIGEGMGLGLPISRKIMLDHGGDLQLEPSESGAVFSLRLPREDVND